MKNILHYVVTLYIIVMIGKYLRMGTRYCQSENGIVSSVTNNFVRLVTKTEW